MNPEVLINARLLNRPISGVERYGRAVAKRLGGNVRLVSPPRALGGSSGHLWEQFLLPRVLLPGSLLWSPANTGPLLVRNQVVTLHDLAPLDHPEWFRPAFAAWYRLMIPELAHRVQHILTPSEFSRQRILARLKVPAENVSVVLEGVDLAVFHLGTGQYLEKVLSRLGLRLPYLLVVGAAPGRKNLARLLKAWKQVLSSYPETTLAIAGPRHGVFQTGPTENVPERVRWLGYLPDEELAALYSGALAFVYPSLYEGFGLCVLEAMACGAPVLCSLAGALPEVAGEAALLVDCQDEHALAAGLRRVMDDPHLRADLRLKGLERARSFRWENTAQSIWELLLSTWEGMARKRVQLGAGWLR